MNDDHLTEDDHLTTALRSLAREKAAPGFTGRVLGRLDRRRPRVAPSSWLAMAAAAAVLLAAVTVGVREWSHLRERQQARLRISALRAEQQALEAELDQLRRRAAAARPLIYLGQTEDLDLVLDLERLGSRPPVRPARAYPQTPTTRPVAFPQGGSQL